MPFLIRLILQRALLLIYSLLVFLGVASEGSFPTEDINNQTVEDRQDAINEIFRDDILDETRDTFNDIVTEAGEALDQPTPVLVRPSLPDIPNIPVDIPQSTPTITLVPPIAETIQEVQDVITESPIATSLSGGSAVNNVVVNTVCTHQNGNLINVSVGSGVMVSDKGVILTNAHVAQHFLLQDYDKDLINCAVYRENIPTFGYTAEILYISPDWIEDNYRLISDPNPRGTGEDDYALLTITGNTNPTLPTPSSFPVAGLNLIYEPNIGDAIIAAGYPGEPSSVLDITSAGNLQTEKIEIADIFTFGGGEIDLITTTRTKVGARGASGGGVFAGHDLDDARLIGTIVTTNGQSGNAQINAIATSYINDDISKESGHNLNYYLSGNLESKSRVFKNEYLNYLAQLLLIEFE